MNLHPTTRLLAWMGLAVCMPWLRDSSLIGLGALVLFAGFFYARDLAWRYVRRSAVLLMSILLLYAFATPGTPWIAGWPWSPTHEGMHAATLQAARLLLLLIALAVALAPLAREQLLSGLYLLLVPLRCIGLPVERLACRLWLTLRYVETAPAAGSMQRRLDAAMSAPTPAPSEISLTIPRFALADAAFMLTLIVGLGSLLA